MLNFKKITYAQLNDRQKENYNFHKLASKLADYGFNSMWLNDDWMGADFIAYNNNGITLKIQLKGRLTIDKKYLDKDIYVGFPLGNTWYVYPHDEVCHYILLLDKINSSKSWADRGGYSWPSIPKWLSENLDKYRLD
jgi:hypothetical protein